MRSDGHASYPAANAQETRAGVSQQFRDYYLQQAERIREWKQHEREYAAWAQSLLESGLAREEVQLIAIVESNMFRGEVNWIELRSMFLGLDPPYTGNGSSRKSISKHLRQEIYEQYQGTCYHCGRQIPSDPEKERAELLAVLQEYDARLREIRAKTKDDVRMRWRLKV